MSDKTPLEIVEERIEEIESDGRYQADSANVQTNSVLALKQTHMEGELRGLKKARRALRDDE
jgi:hypothetical protein